MFRLKTVLKLEKWLTVVAVLLLIIKSGLIFLGNLYNPPFSTDSWAYFELSKYVFTDFFRVNGIRQFEFMSDYGLSFPPLYPVAMAITHSFLPIGIYAGYVLNFIFLGLTLVMLIKLSRLLTKMDLPGVFWFLLLLTQPDYILELTSARSLVLSILLIVILIYVFLRGKASNKWTVLIAFLSGLLALNRFDFLIPGIVLGVVTVTFLTEKSLWSKVKKAGLYYLSLLLTISPWIVYSLVHYGKPFISDNSRTVLSAVKIFTVDYIPSPASIPTLFTEPLRWVLYRVILTGGVSFVLFLKQIIENPLIQQLLWTVIVLMMLFGVINSRLSKISISKTKLRLLTQLLLLAPVFIAQLAMIALTGFLDMRYILIFLLYLAMVLVVIIILLLTTIFDRKYSSVILMMSLILMLASRILFSLPEDIFNLNKNPIALNQDNLKASTFYETVRQTLQSQTPAPVFLVDSNDYDLIDPSKFAALANIKTVVTPSNLNADILRLTVKNYKINYIYSSCPAWKEALANYFNLELTNSEHLYTVTEQPNSPPLPSSFSVVADEKFKACL